jgi:hypothetical protein
MPVTPPSTPIAACLGNGVVVVKFTPPVGVDIRRYEIAVSREEAGEYSIYNNCRFGTRLAYLFGFPMLGGNLYIKIRVVNADREASAWVQAARGQLTKPTVTFECKCISGSIIPAGAVFSVPHPAGRLMSVAAVDQIEFV